ncbi:MAG: peroxiredoxin [bacterium]|jgi:peroxiredoxin
MIIPRQQTPTLSLPLVGGDHFDLSKETPDFATLVVAYRGLHCPICASYLVELDRMTPDFAASGVTTLAVSMDGQEKAQAMAEKIEAQHLRIAYDLPVEAARNWGLYISLSIREAEPAVFSEPGIFLVKPDQTLFYLSVQTMPFARPQPSDILGAVNFAIKANYPARGDYVADQQSDNQIKDLT